MWYYPAAFFLDKRDVNRRLAHLRCDCNGVLRLPGPDGRAGFIDWGPPLCRCQPGFRR
jgi:hypothetical protein